MTYVDDAEAQRERAANNQSLFREVNDRIEDLAGNASFAAFVCECMDASCDETVALTAEEYEHVRQHGNRFIVLPGHEVAVIEEIVEANERFLVVAKLGAGGHVAEHLDPRKRNSEERADRHERAAERHDEAAQRHEESVGFWLKQGDEARASLGRRRLANQRDGAEIERDHAQLERDSGSELSSD